MNLPQSKQEPAPPSLVGLVRGGVLDAEMAALAWLLVEASTPLLTVGKPTMARTAVLEAMRACLPSGTTARPLEGDGEDFGWMPEAVELGWRRERGTATTGGPSKATITTLVADLDDGPTGTWGDRARIAIRALAVGYGMLATMRGARLEDVFATLGGPPVLATDDELARLGLILVLGDGPRVTAAHYLRPVARDEHGHVQRLSPAVIATWDPENERFEHFAWGVATELADRAGRTPAELEREQERRAGLLARAAAATDRTV